MPTDEGADRGHEGITGGSRSGEGIN
jgi:hypothetical protein